MIALALLAAPKIEMREPQNPVVAVRVAFRSGSADDPVGKEALESMLAPGHPYGHPPLGGEAGLKSLTVQDCIDWRAKIFGSGRLTVGFAGGFDPAIAAAFEKRLASLPKGLDAASVSAP